MTYCKKKPQTINTSNFYIDVKKARLKAKYGKKLNLLEVKKHMINSFAHQLDIITDTVCFELNINVSDISAKTRKRHIVEARQIIAFICRKDFKMTFPYLAKKLNRDHSSIIHSVNVVSDLMEYDRKYCEKVVYLRNKCKLKLNG